MSLKQELETIHTAVIDLLNRCNEVLNVHAAPVDTLSELPGRMDGMVDSIKEMAHNEGYDKGYAEGMECGQMVGRGMAYDAFWDAFQQKGSRTGYTQAFAYAWSSETFRPKYDMKPTNATGMFNQSRIRGDLGALLETTGVTLDFSGIQNNLGGNIFYACGFTRLPRLDFTSQTKLVNTFAYATRLETIDEIKLRDDGTTRFEQTFQNASALKHVTFSGTIGSALSLSSCVSLSRASIESVVSCLSDTATGMTLTVSQAAVDAAFETDDWAALIASKPNWTIALA